MSSSDSQPNPAIIPKEHAYSKESNQPLSPLPSPDELARYDAILPGLASRLVGMAEENGDHRRRMERWDRIRSMAGLLCGWTVGMAGFVASWSLGMAGRETTAIAIAGIDILGLIAVFIYGNNNQRIESIEKIKILIRREVMLAIGKGRSHFITLRGYFYINVNAPERFHASRMRGKEPARS